MRLSQMIKKNEQTDLNIPLDKDIVDTIINNIVSEEVNNSRPEGYLQSQLTDGERSTAADIEEDELDFIKSIADPTLTPAEKNIVDNDIDQDTKNYLDNMKDLVS